MELKRYHNYVIDGEFVLLIVPYGIETAKTFDSYERSALLIVPYGIETRN